MFVTRTTILGLLVFTLFVSDPAPGQEKAPAPATEAWARKLLAEDFDAVHKVIKPQPGESRWREVPWLTSLWEARQKAAAAGKPIMVFTGSGGAPLCQT